MAYGITLSELVYDLKCETGMSTQPAQGTNQLPHLKQILKRTQERFYQEFSWSHLKTDTIENLQLNERYYTFNQDTNYDRITGCSVLSNNIWSPVAYGIGDCQYNEFNSYAGEGFDTVQRWRHWNGNQFEVWPIPNVAGQLLKFETLMKLPPLIGDADRCVLDSTLLVLFSASELLKKNKSADWQEKASSAAAHYKNLRANAMKSGPITIGGGLYPANARYPGEIIIRAPGN